MTTISITSNSSSISSYNSRIVKITFTGGNQPMRLAQQTQSVPYNRLSETMQKIHRQGGVVNAVYMAEVSADQVAKPTNVVQDAEPAKNHSSKNHKKK